MHLAMRNPAFLSSPSGELRTMRPGSTKFGGQALTEQPSVRCQPAMAAMALR